MNADTLALAVMDDDGYGCAITGMPADNAYERACARFGRADAAWPAARDLAERILREAGEEYEAADAELARYETVRGIPLPEYRRPFGMVLPDPEPAARPALCPACFMSGTDWGAHRCQGTPEAPCFCFCQFPSDPEPRYIAHFTPEAWVHDQAVEVDAEGPQEWDATAYATEHEHTGEGCRHDRIAYLDWLERCGKGTLADEGVLDTDDMFMDDPAAPEWVRAWRGPFTITVRYAKEGE